MTEDQSKALSMALDYFCSWGKQEPKNGADGKALILAVLKRSHWPSDGFGSLAKEIMYCAISRVWPTT